MALARLDDAAQLTPQYVKEAAGLMGLQPVAPEQPLEQKTAPKPSPFENARKTQEMDTPYEEESLSLDEEASGEETVNIPEKTDTPLSDIPILLPADPYPEDTAPIQRDATALRLPVFYHHHSDNRPRGVIVGTRRTTDLQDISLGSHDDGSSKIPKGAPSGNLS